jgi:hypothetical protein
VVGVHGFFPTRMIRTILGEPTGTSIKFSNEAADAIARWANEKGYDNISIEKIALEGEGKVSDRVESLYKLLCNWLDSIKQADFIFMAAHSQGTPVAIQLLARLITDGHVNKNKHKLGLLAMAGISLGPMPGLDQKYFMRAYSSIENESLMELFEFQNVNSVQSQRYLDALKLVIEQYQNCKIVFIGSMNDQLVPLYSSICTHISHPSIFRAVYVDGQDIVAPEFVSTLISLALRLKNIGSSDHDVVKEISTSLAGALTGRGHSKIYDEQRVYDIALRFVLETTMPGAAKLSVLDSFAVPKPNNNPYILPWCMRGLLNEAMARKSFTNHLHELYQEFENWKPESKLLRDVKYRLSAIQSKL